MIAIGRFAAATPAAIADRSSEISGRVEDVLAGGRRAVEHAAQRAVAQPLQRQRDLAQLVPRLGLGCAELVGELGLRGAQLLDDVGDAHLAAVAVAVGGLERGGEADGFGLRERPVEHRARDRLEQALAHLARADPRQRVQARRDRRA